MLRSCIVATLTATALAIPIVTLPFNSQVPLVARVDQGYYFPLSPNTFASDSGIVGYSISRAPAWLNLNPINGAIFGTPRSEDTGTARFIITASDSSGSADMDCLLLVSTEVGPSLGASITSELMRYGNLSAPNALYISPDTPVMLDFSPILFQSNQSLAYYATLSDRSPLPAWLNFQDLRFSGETPVAGQSPRRVDILLMASDYVGFSAVTIPFTIVVSNRQLYFDDTEYQFSFSARTLVNTSGLLGHLLLDGRPVLPSEITFATSNATEGLKLDPSNLSFSGQRPDMVRKDSLDLNLAVADRYGDIATATVHIDFGSGLFAQDPPALELVQGSAFDYTLDNSLFVQGNLSITVDLGLASSFLSFDAVSLHISGKVPITTPLGPIHGRLTASTQDGSQTETETLDLKVVTPGTATTTTQPGSMVSSTSSADGSTDEDNADFPKRLSGGAIAGVVLGCILILAVLLLAAWICLQRRHQHHKEGKSTGLFSKVMISRPVVSVDYAQYLDHSFHRSPMHSGEHEVLPNGATADCFSQVAAQPHAARTAFHRPFRSININQDKGPVSTQGQPAMRTHSATNSESQDRKGQFSGEVGHSSRIYGTRAFDDSLKRQYDGDYEYVVHPALRSSQQLTRQDSANSSSSRLSRGSAQRSRRQLNSLENIRRPGSPNDSVTPRIWARASITFVRDDSDGDRKTVSRKSQPDSMRSTENGPPTPRKDERLSTSSSVFSEFSILQPEPKAVVPNAQRPLPRRNAAQSPFFAGGSGSVGKRYSSRGWGLGVPSPINRIGLSPIIASPALSQGIADDQRSMLSVANPEDQRASSTISGPFEIPAFPTPYGPLLQRQGTQTSQRTWHTIRSNSIKHFNSSSTDSQGLSAPSASYLPRASQHQRKRSQRQRWSMKQGFSRPDSETLSRGNVSAASSLILTDVDDSDSISHSSLLAGYESRVYSYGGSAKQILIERPSPNASVASPNNAGYGWQHLHPDAAHLGRREQNPSPPDDRRGLPSFVKRGSLVSWTGRTEMTEYERDLTPQPLNISPKSRRTTADSSSHQPQQQQQQQQRHRSTTDLVRTLSNSIMDRSRNAFQPSHRREIRQAQPAILVDQRNSHSLKPRLVVSKGRSSSILGSPSVGSQTPAAVSRETLPDLQRLPADEHEVPLPFRGMSQDRSSREKEREREVSVGAEEGDSSYMAFI